jgi:hypothetical protein
LSLTFLDVFDHLCYLKIIKIVGIWVELNMG